MDFIDYNYHDFCPQEQQIPVSELYGQNQTTNQTPSVTSSSQKKVSNIEVCREKTLKLWSKEDDDLLEQLVISMKNDWKRISKKFQQTKQSKITPFFVKERHQTLMQKKQGGGLHTKKKFTKADDLLLVKSIQKHGLDWGKLSKILDGRNPWTIKNRYYAHLKKKGLVKQYLMEASGAAVEDLYQNESQLEETENSEGQFENCSDINNNGVNDIFSDNIQEF
mmetsp:Transcript_25877/g.22809  ORF Transcript_25877/g.22809 Transcript_25877/m.22809 type:complete len:222 (-) Transcript_25877:1030-1695(-)|eukprot:CAMPEP_0114590280 /NCGR_PEP_ID=MMETSP0125-20121206/12562_1 /TAXON_ID=485358 ORGANISM="Aristerostoma sp., Strain ATCC 50986" /NCGR_SAMPLE_ID=MMETSP0125 /ASSEMBLY_ACC=CAM_ASM_000245 /LENGTH=221 /DNA_ID=CAMNT_0001787677 /DNA_START=487 /DNA_END=1152 /DNA_ORIENTATION=+